MPREGRVGDKPVTLASSFPACVALRHWRRWRLRPSFPQSSTFLRPFAPGPLQALLRSYGRCDSCPPGSSAFSRHEHRLGGEQVSLLHAHDLPTLPSPTTCAGSASSGQGTLPLQRVGPRSLPNEVTLHGNSGLRLSLAGSPHHAGRIEFRVLPYWEGFLRTGRSSCCSPPRVTTTQLQSVTSYVDLERTCTSPTKCAFRRT